MENVKRKKWLIPFLVLVFAVVFAGFIILFMDLGLISGQNGKSTAPVPDKFVVVGEKEEIEGGVHVATGLIAAEGLNEVIANCTGCHSSKIIIQNRATREGWIKLIRWMQDTQNLWDMGEHEKVIVSYLAKHYAPEGKGRRAPLTDIQWYELLE